jgi:hypothetical protein
MSDELSALERAKLAVETVTGEPLDQPSAEMPGFTNLRLRPTRFGVVLEKVNRSAPVRPIPSVNTGDSEGV